MDNITVKHKLWIILILKITYATYAISNNGHVLNYKQDYPSKNFISNKYTSQNAYVENNLYKRSGNILFNNTNNISNIINQYTTDVVNKYTVNKVSTLKKGVL